MSFGKVFERDNHRCVYCCRDMLADFETFWTAQQDHLVPGDGDDPKNLVTACFVCNNLKGDFCPDGKNRKERIASARAHVMARRAEKLADFASWTHSEGDE